MRFLATILAIYFTALSLVQCTDGIAVKSADISFEFSQHQSDDTSTNHEDHCTPFCICLCCGTTVVLFYDFPNNMRGIDLSSVYEFDYTSEYSYNYNNSVWHPPAYS